MTRERCESEGVRAEAAAAAAAAAVATGEGRVRKSLFGGRIGGCLLICHRNVNIQIILNESFGVFFSSFWMFADVVVVGAPATNTHTPTHTHITEKEMGNGTGMEAKYYSITLKYL